MSVNKTGNNRFGNLKTMIYGRTAAIILGFLAQLVLLVIAFYGLRGYSYLFYIFFVIISVVAVVHIFNAAGNPDMKLSWMFPIAIFPIFGAIFYTVIILQPGTKNLYGRLQKLS